MAEPIPLKLPPGLARGMQSDRATPGRYHDARYVRFSQEGEITVIKPMKAWDVAWPQFQLPSGKARAAHAWLDDSEVPYCIIGASDSLYAHDATTLSTITHAGFAGGSLHVGTWTLDNFGERAVACHDVDQTIVEYQPGDVIALAVSGAPTAKAIHVTDEKFLLALGINGDPRAFGWPDQETLTVWTATSLNQAGDLPINENGALMCAAKVRGGSLIWTTTGLHFLEYKQRPDVYGREFIKTGCGIIGRNAKVTRGNEAYWMGRKSFFKYQGYVDAMPCDIADDVFGHINEDYIHKVWGFDNQEDGEIWFPYPRDAATECSHAAIFSYKGIPHWNHTEFPRLAGFNSEVFGYPIALSGEGRIMRHEYGYDYDETVYLMDDNETDQLTDDNGDAFTDDPDDVVPEHRPYLTSGSIEIKTGDRRMQIDEFVPDELNSGDVETYFNLKERPNGTPTTVGPFTTDEEAGVYSTARHVAIEYRSAAGTEDFRIGQWSVRIKQRGKY